MSDPEIERAVAMWLRYAREDLVAARSGLEAPSWTPRHVCFNAQQAAEKAFKARFVARQVQYPFVHALAELASGIGIELEPATKADLDWLSEWAMASRYPFGVDADSDDAQRAVRLAEAIVAASVRDIEAST